ncbi:hypothetical protein PQ465_09135 [Sphingobacterium oryzagri]|uniref:MarR family transcriptional regulator n=1 Tax=Sphingobacterium oryzagri TaxID=3025669 RepID=A0ABY7WLN8_9SPHI|nr:hypothetical protein [Sphingobacterium sp. KACC 22765]WDF70521.1 hypothetical protein PQ465_09135 [Sphingobacterium sp. KACC 22765]
MLTETEIKIMTLLQDPNRTLDLTREVLGECTDLSDSIYALYRKGVLSQPTENTTDDPLDHITLTEFGKLAKLKLP